MKPLILEFAETSVEENNFKDLTEYHGGLNLNVLKGTETPAISDVNCSTETFTKAQVDTTESDDDFLFQMAQILDTRLQTRSFVDETDNDDDFMGLNENLRNDINYNQ